MTVLDISIFLMLSTFMLNLQRMDSCITLFNPQLCTKSLFSLIMRSKHYTERTSTQCQMHIPDHKAQSESKRWALSFHAAT